MPALFNPFAILITSIAGWLKQYQLRTMEYLVAGNRVLRKQIALSSFRTIREKISGFKSLM
jgi:hypothetical protein